MQAGLDDCSFFLIFAWLNDHVYVKVFNSMNASIIFSQNKKKELELAGELKCVLYREKNLRIKLKHGIGV